MKYSPQFNRKFLCTKITSRYYNPLHDMVLHSTCYPAYVKEGARAWILCDYAGEKYPHRLHTSAVVGTGFEEITDETGETVTGYRFTVETENTEYVFETPYMEEE